LRGCAARRRCFDIDDIDIDDIDIDAIRKRENLLHGGAASNEGVCQDVLISMRSISMQSGEDVLISMRLISMRSPESKKTHCVEVQLAMRGCAKMF